MVQKLNCLGAAAVLSALIPLHGFRQTDHFSLHDPKDETVNGVVKGLAPTFVGVSSAGEIICGPLTDDQLFVIDALTKMSPAIALIQPSETAEAVDVEIADYDDGGEAVCAAAAVEADFDGDRYDGIIDSFINCGFDPSDYLCLTVEEFARAMSNGPVDFLPGDGFHLSRDVHDETGHGPVAEPVEEAPAFTTLDESGLLDVEPLLEREEVLFDAADVITGQREGEYGSPEESFTGIAAMWSAYLGLDISPEQAAWMMVFFKSMRAEHSYKRDNYVDAAGYVGIAAELALDDATSPEISRSVH